MKATDKHEFSTTAGTAVVDGVIKTIPQWHTSVVGNVITASTPDNITIPVGEVHASTPLMKPSGSPRSRPSAKDKARKKARRKQAKASRRRNR